MYLRCGLFFNEAARWGVVTLLKMDSGTCVLLQILHNFSKQLILRTPANYCLQKNVHQRMQVMCIVIYCVRATQFMFVMISRGTLSSLTVDFINQISKKPRWQMWQNELCIDGKKLRLIWSAVCFKGKESNSIRVI